MSDMNEFLRWLLFAAAIEAVLGLGFLLAIRSKHRRTTGAVRFEAYGSRRAFRLLILPLAAVLGLVFWLDAPSQPLFVALILATGISVWLQPHRLDQICGEQGVRSGWRSRRFEDLEEWRLTGDHLRFRLNGLWVAVPAPCGAHEDLRTLLDAKCPGRESRFSR